MTFFRIYVAFIIVVYVCYFIGMVIYDFLASLAKGRDEAAAHAEEAVDISDEMKFFKPVMIVRNEPPKKPAKATRNDLLMSGGIEVDRLVPTLQQAIKEDATVNELVGLWEDKTPSQTL